MRTRLFGIVIGYSIVCGAVALAQDAPRSESVVRQQVNDLIANAPNHRATIGTLQGAMTLSISFGAPAWNLGDHTACARFYVATGQALYAAFGADDKASGPARKVLDNLKTALDRIAGSNDPDANAWAMRFVFDLAEIDSLSSADKTIRLIALGKQCLERSDFQNAAAADLSAMDGLHELEGQPLEDIPLDCRYAPLAYSDALFGQKRYAEAAAAAEEGVQTIPQWPTTNTDIRTHFVNRALYSLLLDDLHQETTAHPDDAELQFLMGYHLFFSDKREAARDYFAAALKLKPDHAAAKLFLDACDAAPLPAPVNAPRKGNGEL